MNEFTLLQQLLAGIPAQGEGLLCGIGDDCAVLTASGSRDWLITTDVFVEGVHFRRDWSDWGTIGQKAVRASVSDIAAMGGRPRFLLVAVSLPEDLPHAAIMELYAGIRTAADMWQGLVVGGDTTQSKRWVMVTITAVGEVPHGRAIYRRGAMVGLHRMRYRDDRCERWARRRPGAYCRGE